MTRDTGSDLPGRRAVLRTIGATSAVSLVGGVAAARQDEGDGTPDDDDGMAGDDGTDDDTGGCEQPDCIHPFEGFTVLPESLGGSEPPADPDHVVTSFVAPAAGGGEMGCGNFYFDPAGLAVQPGDVVLFDAQDDLANGRIAGDHTATAYAEAMDRQRRIPEAATAFSSPMIGPEVGWLYRFDEPGVYDIYCGPHEGYGMVLRVVVGGETATDFGPTGTPSAENPDPTPLGPLGAANAVFANLDPETIVEDGRVPWSDDLCSSPS
jgi:plastocyanin